MRYKETRPRTILRLALVIVYLVAGFFHLTRPGAFLLITPGWVPYPRQVILFTGLCEVAGAIGLLTYRFRRAAGIGLAAYAICVFPANIKHALYGLPPGQIQLSWWYHAPRLAFQPVFVWWALYAGTVTSWPFQRKQER